MRKRIFDDLLCHFHLFLCGAQNASVAVNYLPNGFRITNGIAENTMHQRAETRSAGTCRYATYRLTLDRNPFNAGRLTDFAWTHYFPRRASAKSYRLFALFAP
jgi:hypothetical protein